MQSVDGYFKRSARATLRRRVSKWQSMLLQRNPPKAYSCTRPIRWCASGATKRANCWRAGVRVVYGRVGEDAAHGQFLYLASKKGG
jgi:hypothetical protein